jgi:hypothetical protein
MNIMSDHGVNFWASAFARTIQTTLANPLIVIKTRLEVLGFSEYNGMYDAVGKIYKNEGLGGFFTGLKISLLRDVPFSGIFFPIYEMCKKVYSLFLNVNSNYIQERRLYYNALISIMASISANFLSCVITHPLDIIRTRVFFQFYNKD